MKILSIHDLATIRKRAEHNLSLREESNEKVTEKCYGLASGAQHLQILICGGTGCKASSSQGITDNLLKAIKKNEISDKVSPIIPFTPKSLPKMRKKSSTSISSEDEESNGCCM